MRTKQALNIKQIDWKWLALAAIFGAVIVFLTQRPGVGIRGIQVNLIPFWHHGPALACYVTACQNFKNIFWLIVIDVIGNVVVFVPFGFCLAAAFRRHFLIKYTATLIVLAGFFLSLSVELGQLTIPSRSTDVDDLLFNTLGTIIGLSLWFGVIIFKRGREAYL